MVRRQRTSSDGGCDSATAELTGGKRSGDPQLMLLFEDPVAHLTRAGIRAIPACDSS